MDSETVEGFAKYRLNKAKETLETAEMILKEGKDLTSANNRAYYAIFYAIRAVLAIEEIDFKRHKDVLAYFNTDLKARGMMGDTGSNVLGISIGVLMALGYGIKVRLAWLVFLILMHLITEKFSLTKIIEKNRVLKFIDNLGR